MIKRIFRKLARVWHTVVSYVCELFVKHHPTIEIDVNNDGEADVYLQVVSKDNKDKEE